MEGAAASRRSCKKKKSRRKKKKLASGEKSVSPTFFHLSTGVIGSSSS